MDASGDKFEKIKKISENERLPVLMCTVPQGNLRGRQLIDAGSMPGEFHIQDWFEFAVSAGYALYSFSKNKIDGILQSDSFFWENGKWYVGNLKCGKGKADNQEAAWYRNPYQTGDDIYLFGMFLYRILNEGKFPFTDEDSFEGNALSRKDSKERIPLPSLGTDFMKELVCRIVNGQVTRQPDEIKRWLSDLYGMYEALLKNADGVSWLDEGLRSLDDREVADRKEKENFPLQEPKVIYFKMMGVLEEAQKEVQEPKEDEVKLIKKEKADIKKHNRMKKSKERTGKKKSYKEINKALLRRVCIVLVISVCVMAGLIVWLQNMNYQQVYSYIDSGSYALALSEMQEKYNDGRNIDKVVEDYIESCCDNYEYKRVSQAITLLSDKYCQEHIEKIKAWADIVTGADPGLTDELKMVLAKKNVSISEIESVIK